MIRVNLNYYRLDLKNPEEKAKYEEIKAICKGLGHQIMSSIGSYDAAMPDVQTVETEFLFNNQINTAEGYRIFDWKEAYLPAYGNEQTYKIGYYLTGDIEALHQARANQLCCGYCGKRYDKQQTEIKFCNACLDSEYLKEENLPLLLLQPISQEGKRHEAITENVTAEIHAAWDAAKPKMIERMEVARRKRLNDKATRLERDLEKNIEETRILTALLRHGIDTSNLIYYTHTNQWTFGWSKTLVESERAAIIEQLRALDDYLLPDLWIESLEWKMERDAQGFPVASRESFGTTRQHHLPTVQS